LAEADFDIVWIKGSMTYSLARSWSVVEHPEVQATPTRDARMAMNVRMVSPFKSVAVIIEPIYIIPYILYFDNIFIALYFGLF
jgi:hypothetical protein